MNKKNITVLVLILALLGFIFWKNNLNKNISNINNNLDKNIDNNIILNLRD
jgi:hypothetical protein